MLDFLKLPSLKGDAPDADEPTGPRGRKSQGPQKFRTVTNGQIRRARDRAIAGQYRRTARAQRRAHWAKLREHATLRGHLQAIGLIEYGSDFQPTDEQRLASAGWIIANFPTEDVQGSIQAAFDRFSDLSGVERSAVEYNS